MKVYDAASIRNVAVTGHGGCGKTQLVSALLFTSGMVNRLGKVDEGNNVLVALAVESAALQAALLRYHASDNGSPAERREARAAFQAARRLTAVSLACLGLFAPDNDPAAGQIPVGRA